jgi:hypothetical protein
MGRPKNPPPATGEDLRALEAAWQERGPEAIQAIRDADPIGYVRMIVQALGLDLDDD